MMVHGVSFPLSKKKTRNPQRKSKGRELTPLKRWALVRIILDWVRREFSPYIDGTNRYGPFLDRLERVVVTQGAPGAIA